MGAGLKRAAAAARATRDVEPETSRLYDAVLAYLRAHEWNALTIGGVQIKQDMDDRAMNFQFVVRFTGKRDE